MLKRRLLAMLLGATMTLALLAGCTGGDDASSGDAGADSGDAASGDATDDGEAKDGPIRIAFVPKSMANPYYIMMEEGILAAAEASEVEVEILTQSPDKETDVEAQMQIIENMISQQVDAIITSPAGSKELAPAIKKANDAGIPVYTVDTRADADALAEAGASVMTYIGSDNYFGGQLAAEEMLAAIPEGGKVAIIEGVAGHDTSTDRVTGFTDKAAEDGKLEVVASQPANWEQDEGYTVAQNILQANPDLVGIFAANDLMALGTIKAIEDAGLTGITVIGFDATDDGVAAVQAGKMYGTIAQYPDEMGYIAVEAAVDVYQGGSVEAEIPVEVKMVKE